MQCKQVVTESNNVYVICVYGIETGGNMNENEKKKNNNNII